jgi:NADH dehydrogenase FAD-containing subunit
LQLKGHPNIFAGGDVIEWAEQKQKAEAGIIEANVVAYLEGKSLREYKGSIEMISITNGRVCAFPSSLDLSAHGNIIHRTVVWVTLTCCVGSDSGTG